MSNFPLIASARASLRRLLATPGSLLVPLAALVLTGPRLRGISCGHDFDFHLVSWLEVRRSWAEGVLYPHWAQSPNWGAGEPRLVFYPPVTWLLGAILSYGIAWNDVAAALTLIALVATGYGTLALARKFLSPARSALAGVLATTAPYVLFTAYERTAFGELLAAAFLPVILLLAWHKPPANQSSFPGPARSQWFQALDTSTTPLALVVAFIWLTNAPAGVMASYLLAFAALAAALLERSWWPVLRAGVATAVGLGLAAFYLVPAAYEQKWIAIQQAIDVGMRISDSWLFSRHAAPDLALHDHVLLFASTILVSTALFALAGFIFALRSGNLNPRDQRFWIPLAIALVLVVLLQFPVSAPVWRLTPKLEFLQFPWRWTAVLDLPFAIFLAAAAPLKTRRARSATMLACALLLIASSLLASMAFFQSCDQDDSPTNQKLVVENGTGVDGTDEYAPAGADNSLLATNLPQACLVSDPLVELGEGDTDSDPVWYEEQGSCDDTFTAALWQSEHKVFDIESDHDGYVVLRLRRYPAWVLTVNGIAQPQFPPKTLLREDGLMVVPVPQGLSTVDIRWSTTADIRWGRNISLAALLLLVALSILERRLRSKRLPAIQEELRLS